ncbi:hypothetical protein TeGR_g1239, partial [Tetraparma gracilis]
KGIASLVCLKTTLKVLPAIVESLDASTKSRRAAAESVDAKADVADDEELSVDSDKSDGGNELAVAIQGALSDPELAVILEAIEDVFTDSTAFAKSPHAMRHQEIFALRPSTDGMMDVLRKAFLANVDDIYSLADALATDNQLTVRVKENSKRGYYLQIPAEYANTLPTQVIQPVKSGKFIHCTTDEVFSLNARAQENVRDLIFLTHLRIQEVLDFARQRFDALASMVDAVALLDMCHGFADCVASSSSVWCRPVVSDGGTLAILEGRYPIEQTGVAMDFVPNDVFASPLANFTLISG